MTTPIVLDASLAFALVTNESSKFDLSGMATIIAVQGAVAPRHWPLEVTNALTMSVRRKRISKADRTAMWDDLKRLAVQIDLTDYDALDALGDLADRHNLTTYDAAYLELAMRTGYPLTSLDGDLRAAAKKEKLELLPV